MEGYRADHMGVSPDGERAEHVGGDDLGIRRVGAPDAHAHPREIRIRHHACGLNFID